MKKTIKKYLSIMLAVAMIVSSLTYYHSSSTDVKAAQSDAAAYDWSGVSYAGDANTGNANKYKYVLVAGSGNLDVIQKPAFADSPGMYMTFGDSDFGNFELNGTVLNNTQYATQGAGIIVYVSNYTQKYNDLVIKNSSGVVKAEFYVYYEDGTTGETVTTTTQEASSISTESSEASNDPYAGETWKKATNGAYKLCIVGKNTLSEFNGTCEVQGDSLYAAGSGSIMTANYKSATLNGEPLEIWQGALIRVSLASLTQNADNILNIVDFYDNENTVIIRAGRPSYEEVIPPEVQSLTITPNTGQIANTRRIWAGWTNPTYAASAYAYIGSAASGKDVMAADGYDFNQSRPYKNGIDNVTRTKDGSVTVEPGGTYTLVVEVFDYFGDKIAAGSVEITIPDLTDDEANAAEAKTKVNTAENLALNKTAVAIINGEDVAASGITDGNAGVGPQQSNVTAYRIDLGETMSIGSLLACWEASNATAYQIQVSTDNETYTTVANVTGLDNNKTQDVLTSFDSVQARYVKINITGYSSNATTYGLHPFEFAIFGGGIEYTQVDDDIWEDVGIFNVYSSDNDRKSAYYGTGTDDDFSVKFIGAHTEDGDSQLGIDVTGLTNSYEYDYSITFDSNKAGTMKMQVPGANDVTTILEETVNAGTNTITGSFIAGVNPQHGQIMLFPEGMADGTIFDFSDVTVTRTPQKAAPAGFTAAYVNDTGDIAFNWTASDDYTTAKLYVDGIEYAQTITNGQTINVATFDENDFSHTYSIEGVTSDSYRVTARSSEISLEDYIYSKSTFITPTLYPDSKTGIGNNYSRFHDTIAFASSVYEYQDGTFSSPSRAIDNNPGSGWESVWLTDPQYIIVDFGKVRPIKEIDILWQVANAKDYEVLVSDDNVTYTSVASLANRDAGNRSDTITLLKNNISGRYVKVNCTSRTVADNYGYFIYDLAIYGSDAEDWIDPTPTNLSVTHTYGLNAEDDYLTVSFNSLVEADSYKLYADWNGDGVNGYVLVGTVTASGGRITNVPDYPGVANSFVLTSVVDGNESDESSVYTLNYSSSTVHSSTVTYSNGTAGGTVFADKVVDGVDYYNYSRYVFTEASASSANNNAPNAIDGNAGTQWETTATDPQYLLIDLNGLYTISEFDISWNDAIGKTYTIETSIDGETWTTQAKVRNASNTANRTDYITLNNSVDARYVRLNGVERWNPGWGYGIYEFAIFGPDEDQGGPDMTVPCEYTPISTSDDPKVVDNLSWTAFDGLSSNGARAYMVTSVRNEIIANNLSDHSLEGEDIDAVNNDLRLYHLNNGTDHMFDNNLLVIGLVNNENYHVANIESVCINDTEYIVPRDVENEKVYVESNCVYFDESVLSADPGETKYYVINLGEESGIDPFLIKVVGADRFTYTIGGDGQSSITYTDTPIDNANSFTGTGGYSFTFDKMNNGFYKTKEIDSINNMNYLRYSNVSVTATSERQLAQYAVDSVDKIYGNSGTRWESVWDSPYSNGESITIDMGAVYDINELDILWERANAKNFNIQVSTDGTTWKEVFGVTNANAYYDTGELNDQDQPIHNSDRVDTIKLASTTSGRYVKITGTSKNHTDVGDYGYSIWDIAVYGPTPSKFVDNVYATYARDEAIYARWDELLGASYFTTKLIDSEGDDVTPAVRGESELATVLDASELAAGTYTVLVEAYDSNDVKLAEGTRTVTVTASQDKTDIHENAGAAPGGVDRNDATLTYEATVKNVHGAAVASDLGLNISYARDASNDTINVAYNYELNDVRQAVVFVNGKEMTAEDGLLVFENQLLKINETVIPENSITTYDIYLTIAHVRLVVNKGEIGKSQAADLFESPEDLTVLTGTEYTFRGSAGGSNVTYQWQYQDGVGAWTNITGTTTNTLTGIARMAINGRKFRFIAQAHDAAGANVGQPVTSDVAILTVLPRDVSTMELHNDDGDVYAQWASVTGATGYTLTYTYGGVIKTIEGISADAETYDFTSAYAADSTLGYPDNGTTVTLTPSGAGEAMTDTAQADLYIDSVSVNNGGDLVAGQTYNSKVVVKNRGTAWVDISTTDFVATASTTGWTPSITGTSKDKMLPDMSDSVELTFADFTPATAGDYTIGYAINTKMVTQDAQEVHAISESSYDNNTRSLEVTVLAAPPTIKIDSSKSAVQGFQIRTNQGEDMNEAFGDNSVAFRTVCSAPSVGTTFTATNNREYTVARVGVIYYLSDVVSGINSSLTDASLTLLDELPVEEQTEVNLGSASYTYTGKGTQPLRTIGYLCSDNAILSNNGTTTTYAITMKGMDNYLANSMMVRTFVVATDGTFVYSNKIARVSVAEIADYMYVNSLCNNDNGHDYLYDTILHNAAISSSKYYRDGTERGKVEYGWNSTLYDKLPD